MAQSSAKQIETALLTEHLRFTPLTLLDDIINSVNILMNRAVDAAEQGLFSAPVSALGFTPQSTTDPTNGNTIAETQEDLEARAKTEIEEGIVKLETLLESNVDKNFDKLEIYVLRNILCVPPDLVPWVRLNHYEGLDFSALAAKSADGSSKPAPSQETIQAMRKQFREKSRLNAALSAQVAQNKRLIEQIQGLTASASATTRPIKAEEGADTTPQSDGALAFLHQDAAAQKLGMSAVSQQPPIIAADEAASASRPTGPIETNTAFAVAQLPALKALVAELRGKAAAVTTATTSIDPSRKNADVERRLYIESQTRKIVERRRGITPGAESANKNGHDVQDLLSGRRVGTEEVAALERIVKSLQQPERSDRMEQD